MGAPRVIVGGIPLGPGAPRDLAHTESLVVGYAHAFRLVIPSEEVAIKSMEKDTGSLDTASLAKAAITNLDVNTAMGEIHEETSQLKGVMPFIQHLSCRTQEGVVSSFLRDLH